MNPLGFFKPKLSVDLGEHSAKFVVVDRRGQMQAVWEQELIPARNHRDQRLVGDALAARLQELVKAFLREGRGAAGSVVTGVVSASAVTRYVEMPLLSPNELKLAVRSKAREYIPFPLEEAVIFYIPVPLLSDATSKTGVFFVALPRSEVDARRSLLQQCGLKPDRTQAAEIGLVTEFSRHHAVQAKAWNVLLHVGFRSTRVIFSHQGYPYFSRDFGIAGADFTHALQMGFQCDWAEAETRKRAMSAMERETCLEPFLLRWLDEVKTSLRGFAKRFPGSDVMAIHLSGGAAHWRDLDKRVEECVELPVKLDGRETEKSASYKLAVGLAMSRGSAE